MPCEIQVFIWVNSNLRHYSMIKGRGLSFSSPPTGWILCVRVRVFRHTYICILIRISTSKRTPTPWSIFSSPPIHGENSSLRNTSFSGWFSIYLSINLYIFLSTLKLLFITKSIEERKTYYIIYFCMYHYSNLCVIKITAIFAFDINCRLQLRILLMRNSRLLWQVKRILLWEKR